MSKPLKIHYRLVDTNAADVRPLCGDTHGDSGSYNVTTDADVVTCRRCRNRLAESVSLKMGGGEACSGCDGTGKMGNPHIPNLLNTPCSRCGGVGRVMVKPCVQRKRVTHWVPGPQHQPQDPKVAKTACLMTAHHARLAPEGEAPRCKACRAEWELS